MTRDELLAMQGKDLGPAKRVNVPEWGNKPVYLRKLTLGEHEEYVEWAAENRGAYKGLRGRLLVRALCDENGQRLFSDDEVDVVAGFSVDVLNRLFDEAREHCGFNKMAKELEKNSESGPSGDSSMS